MLVSLSMPNQTSMNVTFFISLSALRTSEVALVVKILPDNAGDLRDVGLISRSGRSPGGGNGNLLQYSCLENPMDRGAWRAAVHGVAESDMTELTEHPYMPYEVRLNSSSKIVLSYFFCVVLDSYF